MGSSQKMHHSFEVVNITNRHTNESERLVKRINQRSMELVSKDHDRLYSRYHPDREDRCSQHLYYSCFLCLSVVVLVH